MTDFNEQLVLTEAVLSSGVLIPPLPESLLAIQRLIAVPDADLRKIAFHIGKDMALSGAFFRVANSPVFHLKRKLTSIEQVITLIGMNHTISILCSESLKRVISESGNVALIKALWARFENIADLSLALARLLRLNQTLQELTYTVGIFHDCGICMLIRRFPDYGQAFENTGASWPDVPAIDSAFHTSHTVVGKMVAQNWRLPEEICQAIGRHHDTDLITGDNVSILIAILRLATHFHQQLVKQDDPEWTAWGTQSLELLGINPAYLSELQTDLLGQFILSSKKR